MNTQANVTRGPLVVWSKVTMAPAPCGRRPTLGVCHSHARRPHASSLNGKPRPRPLYIAVPLFALGHLPNARRLRLLFPAERLFRGGVLYGLWSIWDQVCEFSHATLPFRGNREASGHL